MIFPSELHSGEYSEDLLVANLNHWLEPEDEEDNGDLKGEAASDPLDSEVEQGDEEPEDPMRWSRASLSIYM